MMGAIPVFVSLALAHLLADFPLQMEWLYQLKLRSRLGLVVHVAFHLLMTLLLLRLRLGDMWLLVVLGGTHYVLDWGKMRTTFRLQAPAFVLDQGLHAIILALLATRWPTLTPRLPLDWAFAGVVLASIPALLMFGWVLSGDMLRHQPDRPAVRALNEITYRLSKRFGLSVLGALAVLWVLAVVFYL